MPEKYPNLSVMQWKALALVNENCLLSKEKCAHLLYGRQTAVVRCEELLDSLWDLGLVINMGHYRGYKYMTTEFGDDYIENAVKPVNGPSIIGRKIKFLPMIFCLCLLFGACASPEPKDWTHPMPPMPYYLDEDGHTVWIYPKTGPRAYMNKYQYQQ